MKCVQREISFIDRWMHISFSFCKYARCSVSYLMIKNFDMITWDFNQSRTFFYLKSQVFVMLFPYYFLNTRLESKILVSAMTLWLFLNAASLKILRSSCYLAIWSILLCSQEILCWLLEEVNCVNCAFS